MMEIEVVTDVEGIRLQLVGLIRCLMLMLDEHLTEVNNNNKKSSLSNILLKMLFS